MPKFIIFFVGLVPLVFSSDWLRGAMGDFISLIVAITYVVSLRFIAEKFGR